MTYSTFYCRFDKLLNWMYLCMYVLMCVCMRLYVCMYVCAYICLYVLLRSYSKRSTICGLIATGKKTTVLREKLQYSEKNYSIQRKTTVLREKLQYTEKNYSTHRKTAVLIEKLQYSEKNYSNQRKTTVLREKLRYSEKNYSTQRKTCASATLQKISYPWDQTQVSVLRGQWHWAMAQKTLHLASEACRRY